MNFMRFQRKRNYQIRRIILIVVAILVAMLIITTGYLANWTGFGSYIGPAISSNQQFQREKTLWDWMQLLIIPVVLASVAIFFNRADKKNDQILAEQRNQEEREIALDRQREDALQTYLDKMTELLLNYDLRRSIPESEVRIVARARTLTTVEKLDAQRKASLIKFLYEANLISKFDKIVDLRDADLSGVVLKDYKLSEACFAGAYFASAYIAGTDLSNADLQDTYWSGATIIGCNLQNANLSKACMVDDYITDELRDEDYLELTYLAGNNVSGARFSNAFIDLYQLANCKNLDQALLPSFDDVDKEDAEISNVPLLAKMLSLTGQKRNLEQ